MLKKKIKSLLSGCLLTLGHSGVLDCRREYFLRYFASRLLDPAVISRREPGIIRGTRVRVTCDPYMPFHRSMYWFGVLHEISLDRALRNLLKPGDQFVDVGGHFGHVSCLAATLVGPEGNVLAIEANKELAELIKQAARDWPCPVRVESCASGSTRGTAMLAMKPNALGHSTLRTVDNNTEFTSFVEVPVCTLDELVQVAHGQRTVLKIDVEGHEPEVLRGAHTTLSAGTAVAMEWNPQWWSKQDTDWVANAMAAHGYKVLMLDSPRGKRYASCDNVKKLTDQTNLMFCKNDVYAELAQ